MRDFVGSGLSVSMACLTLREVDWPLFHVEIHVFCTLIRFPLVALPWSDPVAFSFPCCFCGWSLWFFVLSLLRFLCVWSPRGRAGLPLPPLLVGLLLCLVLLVVLVCLVFSCGCPPLWPPLPLAFGGADQWF